MQYNSTCAYIFLVTLMNPERRSATLFLTEEMSSWQWYITGRICISHNKHFLYNIQYCIVSSQRSVSITIHGN